MVSYLLPPHPCGLLGDVPMGRGRRRPHTRMGHGREARRGQRCAGTACGDARDFALGPVVGIGMGVWLRKEAGQPDGHEEARVVNHLLVAARLGAHRRAGQTLQIRIGRCLLPNRPRVNRVIKFERHLL